MFKNIKIFGKIILPVSLVVLAGTVVFPFLLSSFVRNDMINRAKEVTVDSVSQQALHHLTRDDFDDPDHESRHDKYEDFFSVLKTKEIVDIKIFRRDGTVIYSEQAGLIGKNYADNANFQATMKGESPVEIKTKAELEAKYKKRGLEYEQLMEVYAPIRFGDLNNGVDAVIEVYFNMDFLNKETSVLNLYVYTISVLMFAFLFVVIMFTVGHFVKKPLSKFVKTAEDVSSGNLSARADIKINDEIGYLAGVFNSMMDGIEKTQKELELAKKSLTDVNVGLEEKVALRTAELKRANEACEADVAAKTEELKKQVDELEKFREMSVGRELRMAEMKKEMDLLRGGVKTE